MLYKSSKMLYQIGNFRDNIIETIYKMMFWSYRLSLISRILDYVSGLIILTPNIIVFSMAKAISLNGHRARWIHNSA
jgi:hypothetical protein